MISQLEVGNRRNLKEPQLLRLAEVLQCDPEELRSRLPVKSTPQPRTEVSRLIRAQREKLGLTMEAFASQMGMTVEQAMELETQERASIPFAMVKPLMKVLALDSSVWMSFVGSRRLKESKSALGQLVRNRRKELGMTQQELADCLKVKCQSISLIELGKISLTFSTARIKQLAEVLKTDVGILQGVREARRIRKPHNVKRVADSLGGFLTARRHERHLTQQAVSSMIGVSISTLHTIETGRVRPSRETLKKISTALDCQIPTHLMPSDSRKELNWVKTRETPLGRFITNRRRELRISQAELGRHSGIRQSVLSAVECGHIIPSGQMLERLAKALDCEIPAALLPNDMTNPEHLL